MNKAFEKILERLEEDARFYNSASDVDQNIRSGLIIAKEAVQEVAEEYNNDWISCSERLPKYGEVVMCSCTNSGITISCITHKGVKPSKSVRFGQHSVIAWQPLPQPYQPNGE